MLLQQKLQQLPKYWYGGPGQLVARNIIEKPSMYGNYIAWARVAAVAACMACLISVHITSYGHLHTGHFCYAGSIISTDIAHVPQNKYEGKHATTIIGFSPLLVNTYTLWSTTPYTSLLVLSFTTCLIDSAFTRTLYTLA